VYFTRRWDFTWRVSDCEELVGENYLKGDQSSVLNILCQYKAIFALQERKKN